ncbi:MAG: lipid-binding SYLF domain-containing protein [Gammaproteobacteria bacterium]|nr:lipid-binding SYLF domain-containing protein [Gammaproteobacteria bacterium]
MFSYRLFFPLLLILGLTLSHQTFALGEAISELADKVGDSVGIGVNASKIDKNATQALDLLLKTSPVAANLAKSADAVLVFPEILKAGMGIGGQHGEGVLKKQGKTVAYYSTFAASYGLQLGAQKFGFALFFMNEESLKYLGSSEGWEVGVGPSVVMVDEGMAKTLSTTTLQEGVYVFTFNQKGLMAGAGIQGSKITQIHPDK